MNIDPNTVVSVSEAGQDFHHVMQIAEQYGQAVIIKEDSPRFLLIDIEKSPIIEMTDDEKIDFVAARILKKHKAAFLELAK